MSHFGAKPWVRREAFNLGASFHMSSYHGEIVTTVPHGYHREIGTPVPRHHGEISANALYLLSRRHNIIHNYSLI